MKIIVIGVVLLLSGCVSQSATLTSTDGKQVHCDQWGFGVIGAPVAMAMHSNCMKKARESGYSEVPRNGT